MNRPCWTVAVLVVAGLGYGCGREPAPPRLPAVSTPPPSAPPAPPPASPGPAADGRVAVGEVTFPVPEGWKSVPPSHPMRDGEMVFPDSSGDPARICVAAFSRAGGDVQSNISRWVGQVLDSAGQPVSPTVSQTTVSGLRVHLVELVGRFHDTMSGAPAPKDNWMMRGAIVETGGREMVFVKMNGPADAMNACAGGWKTLIDGMKVR